MKYAKPEILESRAAVSAIQGTPKLLGDTFDSGIYDGPTPNAYESDE
jgi:hypothetical protein